MSKRTQEELEAIRILEQFAASAPVVNQPIEKKRAPEATKAPTPPKKISKAKKTQPSVDAASAKVKPTRPPNKVLQKFNSMGWMAKGMIILIVLGVFVEIIKKL